ncbi:MAG: PEGA domain-containing protein, partial [Spirochaetia bacterium]|nr:PEGA domain-containing protein [Spirochaetia bacterium]
NTNLFLSDLLTNSRFAYCYTNSSKGAPVSVVASLQRSNTFYIDPMIAGTNGGFLLTNLRPGEFLITNRTVSNLPPLMVFAESNGYVRTLEVVNQIWEGKNVPIGEVLALNGSDYLVTGDMKALPENHLSLSLYLFNQRKGWVKQIFKKEIIPERWYEETATVPQIILAEIQGREIVTNLSFTSYPPGAFVYFNEQYVGATPFTLVAWPAGDYRARLWHANGFFDGAATRDWLATNLAHPSAWVFSNRNELAMIHLEKNFSGTTQHALFLKDNRAGTFRLSVKGAPADLYLNSQLIAVKTNAWEDRLETGSYFLELRVPKKAPTDGTNGLTNLASLDALTNQGTKPPAGGVSNRGMADVEPIYGKKLIRLQIKHEALTDLSVFLKPLPPPSPLGRFLFDHYRNTKLFLILTMTLTAAGSYAFYRYLSYDDKFRAASAQGSGAATFYNSQSAYWRDWATGVGAAAGGAALLTLISRILD